jgi:urease beta subunit
MKHYRIENTGRRGWFVGSFPEAALQTTLTEVCYTVEQPGMLARHFHRVCTEVVLVVDGRIKTGGIEYAAGDILVYEPGEINDTEVLETATLIGVKTPAGGQDKVLV